MASLEGRVIAVTGGASGIGFATAHLLAARGAAISIADVQEDKLTAATESIQKATPDAKVLAKRVDVASSQEVEAWFDEIVSQFGKVDGAVNLAGVTGKNSGSTFTADVDEDDFDFIIGVNLKGVFNCLKAELNRMKDGSIVNASSVVGFRGYYQSIAYCASKVCRITSPSMAPSLPFPFLISLLSVTEKTSHSARRRRHDQNCSNRIRWPKYPRQCYRSVSHLSALSSFPFPSSRRLICKHRGPIDTPMIGTVTSDGNPKATIDSKAIVSKVPMSRYGTPEEVAKLIAFLISEESSYITGSVMSIDGGMAA